MSSRAKNAENVLILLAPFAPEAAPRAGLERDDRMRRGEIGDPEGGAPSRIVGWTAPACSRLRDESGGQACAPRAAGVAPSTSIVLRNPRASEMRATPAKMRLTPMYVPMSHTLMFGSWPMAR